MRSSIFAFFAFMLLFPLLARAENEGFSSLKSDKVNLRTGPGERFPIQWVYQEKHYPVEVLDSFDIWRQIREQDGTIGWVNEKMLSKERYVVIQEEEKLLDSPSVSGRVIAYVQPGVIAKVHSCPSGDFCRLRFIYEDKKVEGWFPKRFVWGLEQGEIID